MVHAMERFIIHLVSATFLTLAAYFALKYIHRKSARARRWFSGQAEHLLLLAALVIFSVLALREPYDIWAGNNSLAKAISDIISWLIGAGLAAFGLYRFKTLQ